MLKENLSPKQILVDLSSVQCQLRDLFKDDNRYDSINIDAVKTDKKNKFLEKSVVLWVTMALKHCLIGLKFCFTLKLTKASLH
jgi:hypothetical protein